MSQIIINDIPVGTIITSVDLNISEANDTILSILEYNLNEINSVSFHRLCPDNKEIQNLQKQLKNNKKLTNFGIKLIQKNGKIIDCNLSAKTIEKQPVSYIFSIEYSSEKKNAGIKQINAEKASNESEEKFRISFQNYPDPVYISTIPDGKIIDTNNAFEKISGYTFYEVEGKTSEQLNFFLTPDDRIKLFDELNKSKRLVKYEISARTKLAKILDTLVSAEFIKIKGQLCLLSVINDVTEKKQSEFIKDITYNITNAVVSTSNPGDFFKKIRFELGRKINISNFYIALYDKKTDSLSTPYMEDEKESFTSWPANKTLTGYVIKKQKPLFITKPEILELINAEEINLVDTVSEIWIGIPLSVEGKTAGAMVVQDYYNPNAFSREDFEILKFVSQQISISLERKHAEDKIKNKLQHFLKFQIDRMPIGLIIWDEFFQVKSWNPAAKNIFGYSEKEAIGKHAYELIVPKKKQPEIDNIWNRLIEDDDTANSTNENYTKNGESIICNWSNTPLKNKDGTVIGVLSMVQDVTQKENAQKALVEGEEKFRVMYQETQVMMHSIDKIGNLISVSNYWLNKLGYNPEEVIGHKLTEFLTEESKQYAENIVLPGFFKTGKIENVQYQFVKKSGEIMDILLSAISEKNNKGEIVRSHAVLIDDTNRKKAENELKLHHEKIEELVKTRTKELKN